MNSSKLPIFAYPSPVRPNQVEPVEAENQNREILAFPAKSL